MSINRAHAPTGMSGDILVELAKAVTTDTIVDIVPQDLEGEAHNILWKSTSPNELTLLKLAPSTSAKSILHEFDKITSYGEDQGYGGYGTFNDTSLPVETNPEFSRHETFVRILGEHSSTFLLASLEKTIKVDGQSGAENIARSSLQKNLMRKKNRALYQSDTSTTRAGGGGARFQGIAQQIREGTDGTTGTSPYGNHSIDMEGQPFTIQNIRRKSAEVITQFGVINTILMDPLVRSTLEEGMDPAQRLDLPISAKPFMLGQNIGGFTTNGGQSFFHTDNTLSPIHYRGRYRNRPTRGAPNRPQVSGAVNASPTSGTSKWKADDAGDCFWIVTEFKEERESLGTRYPVSGATAVAAGEEVELTITPSDPLSDSFKVYRGVGGEADTLAWFIFEVANDQSGGDVSAYDLNLARPGCSDVFGLALYSASQNALHEAPTGQRPSYYTAKAMAEDFLSMEDDPVQNTISVVELGPRMGVMELAKVLPHVSRPLLFSACAMQVRNPLQNIHWYNVGNS